MTTPLTAAEIRVLGCLIEKELATPEYYPLTLNALTAACNQKSNRDPVMSLAEKPLIQKAALGGFVADNEKLGRKLADLVIEVVVNGKKPAELPVGLDEEPKFLLNLKKAGELGLAVPEDVKKAAKLIE